MYKDIAAKSITIKNIYYMLTYAWDTLKTDEKVDKVFSKATTEKLIIALIITQDGVQTQVRYGHKCHLLIQY